MQAALQAAPIKKKGANKLVLGFAALVASAAIGTTGLAAATHLDSKPTKEECAAAGFKNYGQCVKEWAQDKNHGGGGYGGTATTTNTNVSVGVDAEFENSNNNVISVIVNLFR